VDCSDSLFDRSAECSGDDGADVGAGGRVLFASTTASAAFASCAAFRSLRSASICASCRLSMIVVFEELSMGR
jgi:hypothetical protein